MTGGCRRLCEFSVRLSANDAGISADGSPVRRAWACRPDEPRSFQCLAQYGPHNIKGLPVTPAKAAVQTRPRGGTGATRRTLGAPDSRFLGNDEYPTDIARFILGQPLGGVMEF